MKTYSKYLFGALSIVAIALSAGSFIKAYATPASVAIAGQPVDLTYAAEKSLPAVVHIKYVQNSKVQTVEVQSSPSDSARATEASASSRSRLLRSKLLVLVSSSLPTATSLPTIMWLTEPTN